VVSITLEGKLQGSRLARASQAAYARWCSSFLRVTAETVSSALGTIKDGFPISMGNQALWRGDRAASAPAYLLPLDSGILDESLWSAKG
jgi:hypothetical protein